MNTEGPFPLRGPTEAPLAARSLSSWDHPRCAGGQSSESIDLTEWRTTPAVRGGLAELLGSGHPGRTTPAARGGPTRSSGCPTAFGTIPGAWSGPPHGVACVGWARTIPGAWSGHFLACANARGQAAPRSVCGGVAGGFLCRGGRCLAVLAF